MPRLLFFFFCIFPFLLLATPFLHNRGRSCFESFLYFIYNCPLFFAPHLRTQPSTHRGCNRRSHFDTTILFFFFFTQPFQWSCDLMCPFDSRLSSNIIVCTDQPPSHLYAFLIHHYTMGQFTIHDERFYWQNRLHFTFTLLSFYLK